MKSINKLDQKRIRGVAKLLPTIMYATSEQKAVSGEDLLLSGHTLVEGKEIEKDETYYMQMPVYNEVNQYRRLKRAYIKSGRDGIKSYLKPYAKEPDKISMIIDIIFPKSGSAG